MKSQLTEREIQGQLEQKNTEVKSRAAVCLCVSVCNFSNALSGLTVPFSLDSLQTRYYSNAELLPTLNSRFIRIPGLGDESKSNT